MEWLRKNNFVFLGYVEYDFTAALEEKLDEISAGKLSWKEVLRDFWRVFSGSVDEIKELRVAQVVGPGGPEVPARLGYALAREAYRKAGREVVDATVGGKLTIFPKVDYNSLF